MPEGRPIVSDTNSETYRISEYIDSFIKPLSTNNPAYIKNSYDFVDKVRNQTFPEGYLFVTGVVKSLYTNMHIDRMVETVRTAFSQHPDKRRPDNEIIDLLDFTLKNNDFSFNNKQYLQISGCAMGKIYAPSLANLYLLEFDRAAMNDYHIKPELYFRFLDDIHFLWRGGITKLLEYEAYLNTLIPGIEISLEYSNAEIPFLDVLLYNNHNTVQTRTYFKPTDTHQLLHKESYHPRHTHSGILKSQLIRFKRLSSTQQDFHNTCNILYKALSTRGYTYTQFRQLRSQVWQTMNSTNEQTTRPTPTTDILPIIMQYSTVGKNLTIDL